MKNPILWCALVFGLMSVGVSAEPAKAEPVATASKPARCEPATGSRLPRQRLPNGECEASPVLGRAYSQEELERTGSINIGEALRRLDAGIK